MGYGLVILSVYILILIVLSSERVFALKISSSIFVVVSRALLLTLILAFSSSSLLIFYVFFEASLAPTLALILGWGYQPERLQAGVYIIIYTIFASLPLLLVLLLLYLKDTSASSLQVNLGLPRGGAVFLLGVMLAFIVKLPTYLVHL